MAIQIRKAERMKSKLRLGISGPAGSGKTMSALKLANGLGGRVCLIDTENGSGDLYAHLYQYDIITLRAPNYAPKNYLEAIKAAEDADYDVIIIDSLSHAWVGVGGLLDQVDKKGGNSFTAWRDITPQHNALVDAMLASPKHIIATMRSKTEYGTDTDKNGKMIVKKMGLAPVQREGMDYEFTVMMDVSQDHYATVSKDRTNMFASEVFQISEETGKRLLEWLTEGKEAPVDVEGEKRKVMHNLTTRFGFTIPKENPAVVIAEMIQVLTGITLQDNRLPEIVKKLESLKNIEDVQATWYVYLSEKKKAEDANKPPITPPVEVPPPWAQPAPSAPVEESKMEVTPEQKA